MTLFELVAKLVLDTDDFSRDAQAATNQADSMAKSFQGITASAVASGQALYNFGMKAAEITWDFAVDLVTTAAEVQAEQAQFASVFAGVENEAADIFSQISDRDNIHIARLNRTGMSFFTQFKTDGMDAEDALYNMEIAMELAADAAAFYDISLEDASYRLRSFLRGNVEAGEAIGLFSNDLSRNEEAAQRFGKSWKELSESEREIVLLSLAQQAYDNANATGQAAREAENYTNVLGNLQEQWRQIVAVLGAPVLDAVTPVFQRLEQFLKENPELVDKFADGIGAIADFLGDLFLWLIDFVAENSDVIIAFLDAAAGFLGFAPRKTGPGTLSNEQEEGRSVEEEVALAETDRNLNTTATQALQKSENALQAFLEVAAQYNRGEVGESEFNAALFSLDSFFDEANLDRLYAWIEENKIDDYSPGEIVPEEGYSLPDDLMNVLMGLPAAMSESVAGALNGMSVTVDGHTLIGFVSAGMRREAENGKYTG